jgi:tetratricopeptide (TPR) repeat protein
MRRLVAALQTRLEGFLAQRKAVLLVVRAGPAEYLPLVSVLDGIENGDSSDDFLVFADPFESTAKYVAALTQTMKTRYELLAPELQKAGRDLPSQFPGDLVDSRLPPVDRLRALFVFERGLIEDLEAARVVIGLVPSRIDDSAAYAALIMKLVAHELPVPWCHHMRFIVREDSAQPLISRTGQQLPRTEFHAPDFGQAAIAQSLEDEAFDETQPLPLRMQTLMLSAGMDYAHNRLPAAAEKYTLLSRYYAAVGPPVMHALSLNGIGEVLARTGKPRPAQQYFEKALVPALGCESAPALINITLNLANLHRQQERWKDAYEHYEAVSALAKATLNAELQIRCLEQMGFCQYKLADTKLAWEHWHAGVVLARGVDAREDLLECLQRIRNLYKELGMSAREREVAPEIATLERQGVRPFPA